MDITSVIGLIIGIIAIGVGMVLKGVDLAVLLNPAAILIIIFGTTAAVLIAFPLKKIKNVPSLFKTIFSEGKKINSIEYIELFVELATTARKEGLLALEARVENIDNEFLKNGLKLAIDGQSAEFIQEVLMEEIEEMEDRHQSNALIFSQAGTYAPTLGVLGAVVGLIAALGDMSDIDALGHAISAAFVATLLGIFTGYVLWHPFANKLKQKSKEEVKLKQLIAVGILSVQNGESPIIIKQKLLAFIPVKEQKLKEGKKVDNYVEEA